MLGMNGIHANRAIHEQFPVVKALVLTTYDASVAERKAVGSNTSAAASRRIPPWPRA